MKSPLLRLGAVLAASALLSSCASIVSGTSQSISFSSTPPGADILVDGIARGTTPAEIDISVKKIHQVTLQLAGYMPYNTELDQKTNGWIFGNLFFGGLIGIVIDLSDGAIYALTPSQVAAQLTPAQVERRKHRGADIGRGTIYIGAVLKADPGWTRIGHLTKRDVCRSGIPDSPSATPVKIHLGAAS